MSRSFFSGVRPLAPHPKRCCGNCEAIRRRALVGVGPTRCQVAIHRSLVLVAHGADDVLRSPLPFDQCRLRRAVLSHPSVANDFSHLRPRVVMNSLRVLTSAYLTLQGLVRIIYAMTQSKTFTFAISEELKRGLQTVRERDGISEAEQIRRGIQMWLESRGLASTPQQGAKVATEATSRIKRRK